jgi:hypothetical protein
MIFRSKKFFNPLKITVSFVTCCLNRVPQRGVWSAAKFGITAFLLMFTIDGAKNCQILPNRGVANFFRDLKGGVSKKDCKTLGYKLQRLKAYISLFIYCSGSLRGLES